MKYGIDEAYRNMIDLIKKNCQQINCKSHNSVNDYKKMVFFPTKWQEIYLSSKKGIYVQRTCKKIFTHYICMFIQSDHTNAHIHILIVMIIIVQFVVCYIILLNNLLEFSFRKIVAKDIPSLVLNSTLYTCYLDYCTLIDRQDP